MLSTLRQELRQPRTAFGKRYTVLLIITIVASIFFLFIEEQYPKTFPLGSVQLLVIESIILVVFGIDFLLRISITRLSDWRSIHS